MRNTGQGNNETLIKEILMHKDMEMLMYPNIQNTEILFIKKGKRKYKQGIICKGNT